MKCTGPWTAIMLLLPCEFLSDLCYGYLSFDRKQCLCCLIYPKPQLSETGIIIPILHMGALRCK
jgi:hypothetical protein